MRNIVPNKLEDARVRTGFFKSSMADGVMGAFHIAGPSGRRLTILSSGAQDGWEHVSVSVDGRTPNWSEMAFVKELFWQDEEAVMQLHPPKSQYVNCHPDCLHLWRPTDAVIPLPPITMVGPTIAGKTEDGK